MNGNPRLRSTFPSTPQSAAKSQSGRDGVKSTASKIKSTIHDVADLTNTSHPGPLISIDVVDTPTQRLYVFAAYIGLLAWRLYDVYLVEADDAQSLWLFMKWVALDGVFLFGLPALRIPWLEWSPVFTTVLFIIHAFVDGLLMFRIQLPFSAILIALSKTLYDRELAINEKRVKPADVIHNPSLILGKQVIHVLPEGSALLNPYQQSFCLDEVETTVHIPLQLNQSKPLSVELLHVDIDTAQVETVNIYGSQLKKLRKEAEKASAYKSPDGPLLLQYPVKKRGLYLLQKVVDESKLEVQRLPSEVAVVACPRASIRETSKHKCRGALSDVTIDVRGVPPLKIKYRKTVGETEREASLQSIQPDEYVQALTRSPVRQDELLDGQADTSWAQSKSVPVPIEETLLSSGSWMYSVDEVQDALGNRITYAIPGDEGRKQPRKGIILEQDFIVHERLRASFANCSPNKPLKVARGQKTVLPLRFDLNLQEPRTVEYMFTPRGKLSGGGEHASDAEVVTKKLASQGESILIGDAGLYTLKTLVTQYCDGEILEPASCMLQHPPEPELTLSTEEIFDKCAGNPIGLRATLDLIGSPPYDVQYTVQKKSEKQYRIEHVKLNSAREQIELTPAEAGHYTYTFTEVSDAVYKSLDLRSQNLVIDQDVKPAASAAYTGSRSKIACVDSTVSFEVALFGEGPWKLEYELVHNGKRTKSFTDDISNDRYTIVTEPLKSGGEHILALTSITDRMGCTEFLKETASIQVRHQRPKVAFGQIEGRHMVRNLEGQKAHLPLRVTGEPPWRIAYRNVEAVGSEPIQLAVSSANDYIEVSKEGTYELLAIQDAVCPGSVDESARIFEVSWIPRPSMQLVESSSVQRVGDKWQKDDVCEGEDNDLELTLTGTPPFELKYEEHVKPEHGPKSLRKKEISAALNLVTAQTDTAQAGTYEYRFTRLEDHHYTHNPKTYSPLVVTQRVHPLPSAQFTSPGQTYNYCAHHESEEDGIPIKLSGVPPFDLEIEIKHRGAARPEILDVSKVQTTTHNLRIPPRLLQLGHSTVGIRRVRDGRGCTRTVATSESQMSLRVQVSVHDPPSVTALESQTDVCVGERLSFALAGAGPFTVFYTFEGAARRASSSGTTFRRLAEQAGEFVITGVQDSASACRADVSIRRHIHAMPSVKLSQGRTAVTDIPVGGATDLIFEFGGVPPFEFTYTRSANADGSGGGKDSKKNKKRNKGRQELLETRSERSEDFTMRIPASEEGTYEVVAIKDRYCAFAREDVDGYREGQRLLQL